MIKEVENFERKELFDNYNSNDNPFVIVTTKIDVTNIVKYCKEHKNFYATFGYLIATVANEMDAFKYRAKNNKIYYCEELISNYTEMIGNNGIGYFDVKLKDNYKDYIEEYKRVREDFLNKRYYDTSNELNEIWLSCSPWMTFTSLVPPFSKENTIPQFIWDKYEENNDKYTIHLMILVHHGFADGSHIGKFVKTLEEKIKNFK